MLSFLILLVAAVVIAAVSAILSTLYRAVHVVSAARG